MSERNEKARRLLPVAIVACLCATAASPLFAGGSGLRVSVGFHSHHGHYYGHHGHYRPYRYHGYRGYYPYRYAYPHVYYHGTYRSPHAAARQGGLDLNVKPKKTQVYVDGNYVGTTGNFDGWPEHLWLPEGSGSYELIFYNPGYATVVRQVEIRPGVVIQIHHQMQPGESIPPEELTTAKTKTREPTPRHEQRAAPESTPVPRSSHRATPSPPDVLDARQQPARLKLSIAPADASVYLDGRFLGIAGEIGEQRSGILVDPGEHRIEIVRPGYDSRELHFDADPDGEVKLEIELRSGASKARLSV